MPSCWASLCLRGPVSPWILSSAAPAGQVETTAAQVFAWASSWRLAEGASLDAGILPGCDDTAAALLVEPLHGALAEEAQVHPAIPT